MICCIVTPSKTSKLSSHLNNDREAVTQVLHRDVALSRSLLANESSPQPKLVQESAANKMRASHTWISPAREG